MLAVQQTFGLEPAISVVGGNSMGSATAFYAALLQVPKVPVQVEKGNSMGFATAFYAALLQVPYKYSREGQQHGLSHCILRSIASGTRVQYK